MTETKKLTLDIAFTFGDIVFLKTRAERVAGMVTRISVARHSITYCVSWGNGNETWHYEYELTSEFLPSFEGN